MLDTGAAADRIAVAKWRQKLHVFTKFMYWR